jgi:hypothetical protein
METIEVVVYMAIAVILGGLIIAVIGGWDAGATFNSLKKVFSPKSSTEYARISSDQFARAAFETWDGCGLGSTDLNRTVYVTDAVPLNKTMLFTAIKGANLCQSLQWKDGQCGTRDDVEFQNTMGPTVLQLHCDPARRKLVIS